VGISVLEGANPTLVHAFCQPNSQTNFFPVLRSIVLRLHQPRSVSHFNTLFIGSPTTTILETRAKQETSRKEFDIQGIFRTLISRKRSEFFTPEIPT
jgi:hypothetical protein